ncbi:MAG: hypothetical protein RL007_2127 [Bacteroidota bacterium]|jgi:hypothetical protein
MSSKIKYNLLTLRLLNNKTNQIAYLLNHYQCVEFNS